MPKSQDTGATLARSVVTAHRRRLGSGRKRGLGMLDFIYRASGLGGVFMSGAIFALVVVGFVTLTM